MEPNKPLTWDKKNKALAVWIYSSSQQGTKAFNLTRWPRTQPNEYWNVTNGNLTKTPV